MTIDEAEQYLIALKHCETCESNDANDCKACEYHQKGSSAKCYDAIDIGIATMRKYQKQERVLDKIRAEIKQTYEQEKEIDTKWAAGLKYSLKIINKALKELTE